VPIWRNNFGNSNGRVFEAEMPLRGFEIELEILPVCDMESLKVCWDTFFNAKSNFGDLEIVSTQC
jgi:hypothetical protein